jgi:hypothetical protein
MVFIGSEIGREQHGRERRSAAREWRWITVDERVPMGSFTPAS